MKYKKLSFLSFIVTTNIVRYQIGPKNSSNDLKKVIRAKSNDPANKSINAIH